MNPSSRSRPEVLAPAGDRASLDAAVRAGADAVYFGLTMQSGGFNARARAANFDVASLAETMRHLHSHGVKGYVALNTLVFDDELTVLENAVRACAAAGVDAVIVQDLGVAKLCAAIAPTLPVHASTQMTCTDAKSVQFATNLGVKRVILARELSITDIASIHASTENTGVELESFVHGALCVSYSGQCLTSEAIGGRSANRGACAQACRLPYDLIVDGVARELGDVAYLLSPQDLEASALVPELVAAGVRSLKIEGRLKGPEYVAATTTLYRDAARGQFDEEERTQALAMFSRGSGPGFLSGIDHQRMVDGTTCDHRGIEIGEAHGTSLKQGGSVIEMRLTAEISRGDGILVLGGREGEGEIGGRVWAIDRDGADVTAADKGDVVRVWLGPDKPIRDFREARRVFRTNDPAREKAVRARIENTPHRILVDFALRGDIGAHATLSAKTERGGSAEVLLDAPIERARATAKDVDETHPQLAVLREKLGRLGESVYALGELTLEIPRDAFISPAALNRARRAIVDALSVRAAHAATSTSAKDLLRDARNELSAARASSAREGLFVLCRNLAQANAALDAGADGIILDFLELTGTGNAVRALRARGNVHITVTPPRILKPGEEKILSYLASLEADAMLVRNLGGLLDETKYAEKIGDFSLNITNRLSAREVLNHGLSAFTPAFDLDSTQLVSLLDGELAPFAEVVVHHPMPLFHNEHCVFAALLSEGKDHRTCGRPCDTHEIALRDRAGMEHPVIADVGCRNTVFHARSQSGADLVPTLKQLGVRRFRIELVREREADTERIVLAYRKLLAATCTPRDVFTTLRSESGYGVVRGSLRVLST